MLGIEQSELGGCRLIRRIGAGGMGEVYLAEQLSLGNRLVAVKVVRAERDVTPPSDGPVGAGWHFIREAQLLGQLSHPNILPVYHSGVEAGYLFLVMQYAPDGSLADSIKGKGAHVLNLPASPSLVVDIVAQLAAALQYTHDHHVIHSDVKPSNVLVQIEPNGHWHLLLADFGIARSMDSIALRDEVAGTAAYMAPEQFFGQLSPACDQYALGVMAFQLLGARLPFTGGFIELANAHAHEDPPALRMLNPAIPPAVEAVLVRALAKRPEDRYRTVADFAQALRAASIGANSTVLAASSPGAVWAGPVIVRRDATARTSPAATWVGPSPTPGTLAKTVPFVRDAAAAPRTRRRTSNGGGRRVAPGIAVLALLLVTCIAGLSLRTHIDISHAFSSLGSIAGAGTTPTVPATHEGSSSGSLPGAVPTQQGNPVQGWPTPTPTAQATPQSSPQPTASPTAEPTATVPSPTATPAVSPSPAATATDSPQPAATATAQPTLPPATATPQSGATGDTSAPSSTQPAQAPLVPPLPEGAPGP